MNLILGILIILGVISVLVAMLIPPDACYEIWPRQRRLRKSVCNDGNEDI
jgi:hypothetical protein